MKATLFSAKLGRLVLTDQRLVFLSTGKSDAANLAARAAISPGLATRGGSTSALDESALSNDGSFSVPLAAITRCEAGKKRALIVSYRDESGSEQSFAFGEKMGMPGRDTWATEVNARRA